MPHDLRSAEGHSVRGPARSAARTRRAWRRRSKRAQVSAVATILGLLIVVTFIANYIATTLPNTMGQNDIQREVQVENQVAQFSALLRAVASNGVVGAQVLQPVTLGSQGDPPFGAPDSGSVAPLPYVGNSTGNYPQQSINFTLTGPAAYAAPNAGTQGGIAPGCTTTSSTITCSSAVTVIYNFTGSLANQSAYSVTLSGGGTAKLNVSANHASVTFTGSSTTHLALDIFGSNDTVSVTVSSVPETILIFGNYDTVTMTGSAANSQTYILIVGNHDTVTSLSLSGTNTVRTAVYGSSDTVNPGTLSGTNKFAVYFNGFNPASPSLTCPVANLSSSDTVSQPVGGGTFTVTYNNTVYSGSGTNGAWAVSYKIPAQSACPFVTQSQIAVGPTWSAGFSVELHNTYAPSAEVAYDQGAVVYAQPGGLPLFVVPPQISFVNNVLTMFAPRFTNVIAGESGTGTAVFVLQLIGTTAITLPTNTFSFQNGSSLTIRIVTAYAASWYSYFLNYKTLASYVTCTGSRSVCTANYNSGGAQSLGTVTLTIPTTVSGSPITLNFLGAWYAVTLD